MTSAFSELAAGNFKDGLESLGEDPCWRDSDNSLDGPFYLGFPGRSGWGEGLLIASLLKRYAVDSQKTIEALANQQVFSILKHDDAFQVHSMNDFDKSAFCKVRSPLAILRHALTRNLLNLPFVPIKVDAEYKRPVTAHPRIGLAWASIDNGKPIRDKSVNYERFLKIIDGLDVKVISLQRGLQQDSDDKEEVIKRFGPNCTFLCDSILEAPDQTEVVKAICSLDCMVTVSTTSAHIAACLGIPVVLLAKRRKGPQWFWQVQKDHGKCLYPTVHPILGDIEGDGDWWTDCIEKAKREVNDVLSGKRFWC